MKKKHLFWELFPSFLAIVIITLVAVQWYASRIINDIYISRTKSELQTSVAVFAEQVRGNASDLDIETIDPLCKKLGLAVKHRYTVILPAGGVIGDSEKEPAGMDNHAQRPEVVQAFSGNLGESRRYSQTLQKWMIYIAIPVALEGETLAVVRASLPLSDVREPLMALHYQSITAGLLIALVAGFISIFLSGRISRPLKVLREGSEAFGSGNFEQKLPSSSVTEIAVLADTMNQMAAQLNERISTITRQRDEQNSLLFCMMEAVIAIDLEKHVIRMNRSARDLFTVVDAEFEGRNIEELIRNPDLHNITTETLGSESLVEGDVYLADSDRHLLAHGTVLHDAEGQKIGALIVLNDITKLWKLERMRKDFVANVSHELKTPITSIKGFAETILDGAIDNRDDLQRFLQIINKQAGRLQSIVEDLLSLSSIEHDAASNDIELHETNIQNIIDNAVQTCRARAANKNIKLKANADPSFRAHVNVQLLEQALTNLIENAIKYSDSETTVILNCREVEGEIIISVRDEGPGIAKEYQPRVFERFYRVDKSRSRRLGGTGLGLAIVKRVAIAHGGRAEVQSDLGRGSTFSIILPKADESRA